MATSWHADKDAEQLKKTRRIFFFLKRLKIQTPFSFEPSLDAEPKTNSIQPCDAACHFHLPEAHSPDEKKNPAKAWKETSTHWVLGSVRLGLASAKMEWNERGAEDGKQKRLALFSPFLTPDFGSYAATPVTSSSALASCHALAVPEPR